MKIDDPVNANYAATVVRLPKLLDLPNSDNLIGAPLFGFQAIVDRSHKEGDLGIVFPAEVQLTDDYCAENGLFRHSDLNKDQSQKGYLDDNRRVRAIKLRGNRSDCLFMPLESLTYTGVNLAALEVGDTFDTINGVEICRKFTIPGKGGLGGTPKSEKKFLRVDPRLFPEHLDTDNYFRNSHLIGDDEHVYVTQKVHGTSWRGSRSLVKRQLSLRDRIARRFGVKVLEQEYDAVAGSRKVIKDPNNPLQNHFYATDIWTEYLARIEDIIPENFIVYGEIVGYTKEGSAIQTDYTYDQAPGNCDLYVYRVATVNPRGIVTDLSWPQVRLFCFNNGLKQVPDLWEGKHSDFKPEDYLDKRIADIRVNHDPIQQPDDDRRAYPYALPLGPNKKLVDEGVVIRADRLQPVLLKAKSPIFLGYETLLLDKGEVDLETAGSEVEETI